MLVGDLSFCVSTRKNEAQQNGEIIDCPWLERAFRPGEPCQLAWYGKDLKWLVIYFDAQGRIGRLDIKGKDRDEFKYIYNGIRNGSVFQLHASQGQCGGGKMFHLSVFRVGP